MQINAAIGTTMLGDLQSLLQKDGSLTNDDFYRLHHGGNPIRFSRILEKIDHCERRLAEDDERELYEKALSFSPNKISLAWIDPEDAPEIVISPCTDKTVHLGPFRNSPWAVPTKLFRTEVLTSLLKIHPHRNPLEVFCKMTVRVVSKSNGLTFAKVGID